MISLFSVHLASLKNRVQCSTCTLQDGANSTDFVSFDSILAFLAALRVFFRSRSDIALDLLALRQQVAALKRQASDGADYARRGVSLIIRSSTFFVIRWMRESTPNGPANVRAGM